MTGQGALRFRVLGTSALLPEEAREVLVNAHGGFAVDHREGRGETYFFLPGAGILRAERRPQAGRARAHSVGDERPNQHNTKIWSASDGTAYLSFPANDKGRSSPLPSPASSYTPWVAPPRVTISACPR